MRNLVAVLMVVACTPAEAPVAPKAPSSTAPPTQPAYVEAGKAAMAQRDYRKAVDQFSLAIKANPGDASVRTERGKAYVALGEFKPAIEDFSVVLGSQPSADLYLARGNAYCAALDRDRGLADLAEAKAAGADVDQKIEECKRVRTEAERNVDGAMEDLAQEARTSYGAGEMVKARDLARIVLRHRKTDEDMLRIAAMASCKLGDRLFAPRYYAKLTIAKHRDEVAAACAESKIVLQGPTARLP